VEEFVPYEDMTYIEIEALLEKLKDLDDRHEEEDRVLTKWEEHDAAEYETKKSFFGDRAAKTVLDTCEDFKIILSFFGMITLSDRVQMLEIQEKKAKSQLYNEYLENLEQEKGIEESKEIIK